MDSIIVQSHRSSQYKLNRYNIKQESNKTAQSRKEKYSLQRVKVDNNVHIQINSGYSQQL